MNSVEVGHADNCQNMICNVCRDIQGCGLMSTAKSNISMASQNVARANTNHKPVVAANPKRWGNQWQWSSTTIQRRPLCILP